MSFPSRSLCICPWGRADTPRSDVVTREGYVPPAETHMLFVLFGIATTLLFPSVDACVQLQRHHEDEASLMLGPRR